MCQNGRGSTHNDNFCSSLQSWFKTTSPSTTAAPSRSSSWCATSTSSSSPATAVSKAPTYNLTIRFRSSFPQLSHLAQDVQDDMQAHGMEVIPREPPLTPLGVPRNPPLPPPWSPPPRPLGVNAMGSHVLRLFSWSGTNLFSGPIEILDLEV